jgi:hypothetical protein
MLEKINDRNICDLEWMIQDYEGEFSPLTLNNPNDPGKFKLNRLVFS